MVARGWGGGGRGDVGQRTHFRLQDEQGLGGSRPGGTRGSATVVLCAQNCSENRV